MMITIIITESARIILLNREDALLLVWPDVYSGDADSPSSSSSWPSSSFVAFVDAGGGTAVRRGGLPFLVTVLFEADEEDDDDGT